MYYLAYGSNLNLSEMKEKCPFYKVIGRMFLYNYTLSFKGEKIGFLTIEPKEGSVVPIGIFKVNKLFIKNLDMMKIIHIYIIKRKLNLNYMAN